MTDPPADFDVIVVGGGVAGICCAGELLLQGVRPLLVVETKEVASNLRSEWINGNRAPVQGATIHPLQAGGWWLPLAKALKVPLGAMDSQAAIAFSFWPDTTVKPLHLWYPSAESLFGVFEDLSPIPLDDIRAEVLKVLTAGLAIPYDELADMDTVLFHDWLAEQTGDDTVKYLLGVFISLLNQYPDTTWMGATTVFGAWGVLRLLIGGEGYYPEVFPDFREGVFIPMAKAIEEQGGTIWRGSKVARIDTSSGRVGTVVLEDGREVTGIAIAMATGNERIANCWIRSRRRSSASPRASSASTP